MTTATRSRSSTDTTRSRWPDQTETLDRLARRWIEGEDLDADDWELIRRWALPQERDPVKLLPGFAGLCDRLAQIAKKELDRVSLDDKDAQFLRDYGVHWRRITSMTTTRGCIPGMIFLRSHRSSPPSTPAPAPVRCCMPVWGGLRRCTSF